MGDNCIYTRKGGRGCVYWLYNNIKCINIMYTYYL